MKKEQETGPKFQELVDKTFGPAKPRSNMLQGFLDAKNTELEELATAKALLQECLIQLEYLDSRNPTGTTPPLINKLKRFFQ